MAQPTDIMVDILDWGAESDILILKMDMENAFKTVPVKASAWWKQVIEFNGCYFIDGRLLFGSNLAAHYYVIIHLVKHFSITWLL